MRTTRSAPRRRAQMLAMLSLVAVMAAGCLRADVGVKIEGDGSGEIVVEVFPSRRYAEGLEKLPFEVDELIDGAFNGVDGVEFSEIEEDGRTGYRLFVPFDDYQELQQVLLAGGTVADQPVQLFSTLSIVELPDDAGWQLDAQLLPLAQSIASVDSNLVPESMRDLLDSAGVGASSNGFDLSVSLPGTVVSSNATSTDGGTATWTLDDPQAPATLNMRTEPKEFPTPMQLVLGGAGLALVLGIVLFVLGATRKHSSTKQPRRSRARRSKATASDAGDAGWAKQPVGTAPSEASNRPEELPAFGSPIAAPETPTPPPLAPLAPLAPEPAAAAPSPAPRPADWAPPVGQQPVAVPPAQAEAPPAPAPDTSGPDAWAPPVGEPTPVEPPPAPATAPGWYPDPEDPSAQRWWSGTDWTDHRA